GPLRSEALLCETLKSLDAIEEDLSRLRARTRADMLCAWEVRNMALVARAVALAARLRKESRAAQYRRASATKDARRLARQIHARLDRSGAIVVAAAYVLPEQRGLSPKEPRGG